MTRIEVRADDFSRIARELRNAGRQDLRKEMYRGLNRSTKQARANVLDALPSHLPDNYAGALRSDLKMSTSAKGGKSPEVRIRAKGRRKKRLLVPLNQGRLRHPLFGNRGRWYTQSVTPGFWTETLNESSDDVRRQLEEAMADVIRKIAD